VKSDANLSSVHTVDGARRKTFIFSQRIFDTLGNTTKAYAKLVVGKTCHLH